MPQRCQVCTHAKTKEINKRLIQGEATHSIAEDYKGLDYQNIWRHGKRHLPETLVKAHQEKQQAHAEDLWSTLQFLLNKAVEKVKEADAEDDDKKSATFMAEARKNIMSSAKIANTVEKYRRQDEEKEDSQLTRKATKGLKALSTPELHTFINLMAKIKAADPDYDLDPRTRGFVEAVDRINSQPVVHESKSGESKSPTPTQSRSGNRVDSSSQMDSAPSKSARNRKRQVKNSKNNDVEMIDDLDIELDDLDIEKDNTIPSEETDSEYDKQNRPW